MATTDTINIDFHLLDAGEPNILAIVDTSTWGFIESKTAAIEIIVPGSTTIRRYTFHKSRSNIFNSSNLNLSPIGVISPLADGIYKIDVIGAHGNCKHKDILKTDATKLKFYEIYASLGRGKDEETKRKKRILQDIDLLIRSAEALVSRGELKEGMYNFKQAVKDINSYIECETC